jgi:hypothetical protein
LAPDLSRRRNARPPPSMETQKALAALPGSFADRGYDWVRVTRVLRETLFGSNQNVGLNDTHGIGRHPNIELLEPLLEPFLEFDKELQIIARIWYVAEYAYQFVSVMIASMPPTPINALRLGGHGAKSLL